MIIILDLPQNERCLSPQQARYLLRHWYYYDHNINWLEPCLLANAKSLYYRLSYLSEEERAKLAYMYYYPKHEQAPHNSEIAQRYHLKKQRVSEYKNQIIFKLLKPRATMFDPNDEELAKRNEQIKRDIQMLLPTEYRD